MICEECEQQLAPNEVHRWFSPRLGQMVYSCSPKAERSEAAPRCPNSAPGSAGARASDEAGADSLGRSAGKAVRRMVRLPGENFPPIKLSDDPLTAIAEIASYLQSMNTSRCRAVTEGGEIVGYHQCPEWFNGLMDIIEESIRITNPSALAAERERACLPNDGAKRPDGRKLHDSQQPERTDNANQ